MANPYLERAAFESWALENAIRTDLGASDAWQARADLAASDYQSIATALREQGERERTYDLQDAFNRAAEIVERMGK